MKTIKAKRTEEKPQRAEIPIVIIRMMSDEEWNKLAYRNWLERNKACTE